MPFFQHRGTETQRLTEKLTFGDGLGGLMLCCLFLIEFVSQKPITKHKPLLKKGMIWAELGLLPLQPRLQDVMHLNYA